MASQDREKEHLDEESIIPQGKAELDLQKMHNQFYPLLRKYQSLSLVSRTKATGDLSETPLPVLSPKAQEVLNNPTLTGRSCFLCLGLWVQAASARRDHCIGLKLRLMEDPSKDRKSTDINNNSNNSNNNNNNAAKQGDPFMRKRKGGAPPPGDDENQPTGGDQQLRARLLDLARKQVNTLHQWAGMMMNPMIFDKAIHIAFRFVGASVKAVDDLKRRIKGPEEDD